MVSIIPKAGAFGPMIPITPDTTPAMAAAAIRVAGWSGTCAPIVSPTTAPPAWASNAQVRSRYVPRAANATAHAAPK
ncbi:hypothetical protein [Williamsia sp. 1135]|uniref:hypothetical protein n=1 Tax=Williamsia sp. 1135 TaxID=1889262 RepID=UPI00117DB7E0|nr:hypothetical protein [Williamsia sp. 1135]